MDVKSGKILSINKQIDKVHHQQVLENQENLPLRAHRDYGPFNIEQEPECNELILGIHI